MKRRIINGSSRTRHRFKPLQLQPHLNDVHTVFGKVTRGLKFAKDKSNGDVMKEVLYKVNKSWSLFYTG